MIETDLIKHGETVTALRPTCCASCVLLRHDDEVSDEPWCVAGGVEVEIPYHTTNAPPATCPLRRRPVVIRLAEGV